MDEHKRRIQNKRIGSCEPFTDRPFPVAMIIRKHKRNQIGIGLLENKIYNKGFFMIGRTWWNYENSKIVNVE